MPESLLPVSTHSHDAPAHTAKPRQVESAASGTGARLVSQTARDLRLPLSTVRESIRVVQQGDLGAVTPGQHVCLSAALDQCECMGKVIEEMIGMQQLRSGNLQAQRQWISVDQARKQIDRTLDNWTSTRHVTVLWDGVDNAPAVFVDPTLLRRLVVNLVTGALRNTPDGGQVLIQLQPQQDHTLRWAVIDWGKGISESELQSLQQSSGDDPDSAGVDYSVCRQLAAMHFSTLSMRSRLGRGTEVSFRTACAGPHGFAEAWSRWRIGERRTIQPAAGNTARPPQHGSATINRGTDHRQRLLHGAPGDRATQRVRLDAPLVSLEMRDDGQQPHCADEFTAVIVSAGAAVLRHAAERFEKLLHQHSQLYDVVYPITPRRWVWICDADARRIREKIDHVRLDAIEKIPGLRVDWAAPQTFAIDPRRTAALLSDLLVRETLAAAASQPLIDNNEVRLGTSPIVPSDIASARLDDELARLGQQMHRQNTRLRQQINTLRPAT